MSATTTELIEQSIADIQRDVQRGALTADMAREHLFTLTALVGNCSDDFRRADLAYKPVVLAHLTGTTKANRARIEAECSEEYAEMRAAQDRLKTVEQLIVTCRTCIRSLDEERRNSR